MSTEVGSPLDSEFLHEPGSDALIRIPRTLMADLRAMGRGGATAAAAAAPATPSSPAAPAAPVVVVAFDKQIASMLDIDGVIKTASVEKFVSLIELARQQAEKEQTFVLYTLKQSSAKSVFVIEFIKHGGVTALNNWLEHERLSGVTNDKLVLKLFKLLEPLPMTLEVLQRSSVGKTVKKFTASKYSPTIRKLAAKLIGDWMSLIEAKAKAEVVQTHVVPSENTRKRPVEKPTMPAPKKAKTDSTIAAPAFGGSSKSTVPTKASSMPSASAVGAFGAPPKPAATAAAKPSPFSIAAASASKAATSASATAATSSATSAVVAPSAAVTTASAASNGASAAFSAKPSSSLSSLRPATRKSKVQLISPEALIASETSVGNGDLVASASSSSLSSESSSESSSTSSSEPSLSGSSSTLSILPNAAVYTPKPLSLDEVRKQKSYERLLMESAAASAPPRPLPSAPLKSILRKAPAPDPTAMTPEEREERASQQKAVSWASKLERLRTFKRDRRDTPHAASAIAGQHPQFRQAAKQEHIKEREAMGVKRQNEHQVWRKRAEKMLPTQLSLPASERVIRSEAMRIETERQSKILAVFYMRDDQIPAHPTLLQHEEPDYDDSTTKIIPLVDMSPARMQASVHPVPVLPQQPQAPAAQPTTTAAIFNALSSFSMSDVSELSSILLHRQQAATQRSPGSGSPAAAPSPLHYSAAPSPSPAATSSSAAAAAIPNGPALYGPGPAPGPAADYHQASHASYQHQQPQAQAHPHQALPHTQRPPYPSPPPQSQPSQPPHRQHHFSAIPPPPPVPPHFQSAIESLVRPGASNLNEALGQLVAANFDTELLSAYIKNPSTDNMHALIRAWHAKQALSPQPQQHHHQQHQPPPSSSSSQSQHHRYPPHHQSQQPMSSRAPPSSRSSYPADKDVEVYRRDSLPPADTAPGRYQREPPPSGGRNRPCTFYNRKGGCKNGSRCPFLHEDLSRGPSGGGGGGGGGGGYW